MGGVADFVGDVVGDVVDSVGDIAGDVIDVAGDALGDVVDTIGSTVERALDDPIGTIATIAAVATGNAYLIPYINAANTVAQGGDLGDAIKAGTISYAAGQVGAATGEYFGGTAPISVDDFGVPLLPADVAYNAATQTGLGYGSTVGNVAANTAGAATGAVLSGGDPMQAVLGSLTAQGVNAGFNAAGQIVSDTGQVLYNSATDYFNQTADQPGDYPTTMGELDAANTELGGMPSYNMVGDQPGDYPTNSNELQVANDQLATMPSFEMYGDQPGDYPTNAFELQEANNQLAEMPGAPDVDNSNSGTGFGDDDFDLGGSGVYDGTTGGAGDSSFNTKKPSKLP